MDRPEVPTRPYVELNPLPQPAVLDVPVLFSVRDFLVADSFHLPRVRSRVRDAHRDQVLAAMDLRRDVKFKWQVAAFMRAHFLAVDVNVRAIINRAEAKQDDLVRGGRIDIDGAPVPRDAGVVPQVGELGLPGGGHARGPDVCRRAELADVERTGGVGEEIPVTV